MKLNNALLIQPISAAKMTTGLNPDRVLSTYFGNISTWVATPTNDVAFVFTTGLYQNNESQSPRAQRMSLLQREGEWRIRFDKLMHKNEGQTINGFPLIRRGFQFAGWDDGVVENWKDFTNNLDKLRFTYARDNPFKSMIVAEIKQMGREPTDTNIAFIFEEIALTAVWLKGGVPISKGLRTEDNISALHLVYPSPLQKFMAEGLKVLLKDKKDVLPLVWLDTSDASCTVPSTFRFGRNAPAMNGI